MKFYHRFVLVTNDTDLFVCGKCKTNFTELEPFLIHRGSCRGNCDGINFISCFIYYAQISVFFFFF